MFNQIGVRHRIPRFQNRSIKCINYTPAWEQRKFSDIVDVAAVRIYKHLEEGPIPVYGTGVL